MFFSPSHREEIDKLRGEIREHIRSSLCQHDQTIEMTKCLHEAEKKLQQSRSEIVRLKIESEKLSSNENVANAAVSPPRSSQRIVENLQHIVDNEKDSANFKVNFKERVVLQDRIDPANINTTHTDEKIGPNDSQFSAASEVNIISYIPIRVSQLNWKIILLPTILGSIKANRPTTCLEPISVGFL